LKFFAKKPGKTSQKRSAVFIWQVALRLKEYAALAIARRYADPEGERIRNKQLPDPENKEEASMFSFDGSNEGNDHDTDDLVSKLVGAKPIFDVVFKDGGDSGPVAHHVWKGKPNVKGLRELHPLVLRWFENDKKERKYSNNRIGIYAEYQRDKHRFRAHANYQSTGAWYDWVMIRFRSDSLGSDDDDSHPGGSAATMSGNKRRFHEVSSGDDEEVFADDLFPSKLLCFFNDPVDGGIRALVHTCEVSDHTEDSVLIQIWHLEYNNSRSSGRSKQRSTPVIRSVDVSTLDKPILVVEEMPGLHEWIEFDPKKCNFHNRCLVLMPRLTYWAKQFTS
jgi:hypothetical protein